MADGGPKNGVASLVFSLFLPRKSERTVSNFHELSCFCSPHYLSSLAFTWEAASLIFATHQANGNIRLSDRVEALV